MRIFGNELTASGRFFHFKGRMRKKAPLSYRFKESSPPHGGLFSYPAVQQGGFSHARTGSRPRRTAHGRSLHGRAAYGPADRADRGGAARHRLELNAGRKPVRRSTRKQAELYVVDLRISRINAEDARRVSRQTVDSDETYAKKILILFAGEDECLIEN